MVCSNAAADISLRQWSGILKGGELCGRCYRIRWQDWGWCFAYLSVPNSNYIRIKIKFRVTGNDFHIFTQCCRDNVSIKWIFVFFMHLKRLIIEDMGVANRNCFDSCLPCMDYDILKAYWNLQLTNINFNCHLPKGNLADKNL